MPGRRSELPKRARSAIGAELKRARVAAGKTLEDVAFALSNGQREVDLTWLQKLEKGRCPYPFANPVRLADAMRYLGTTTWEQLLRAGGVWDGADPAAAVFRE